MTTTPTTLQLTFPAPEQLLWVCPACGPQASSRIAPSQVFRRASPTGIGNSEWRKIECTGCQRRFMLRIDSSGQVTGLPINPSADDSQTGETIYSAVDSDSGDWLSSS